VLRAYIHIEEKKKEKERVLQNLSMDMSSHPFNINDVLHMVDITTKTDYLQTFIARAQMLLNIHRTS